MMDHPLPQSGAQDVLVVNARIITLAHSQSPRRGREAMRELSVLEGADILVHNGRIKAVGVGLSGDDGVEVIDAGGRVVLPGFVDCHTHACWAGDRLDEFQMKQEGADYLTILKAGGGIMSTVRATRKVSLEQLTTLTVKHINRLIDWGTTTVEVKTGYGLNPETELKMLRAIQAAAAQLPIPVIPTFLGAHAIDPDQPGFIERTINETLPAMVEACPGITCDAYCEDGAWSLEDTRLLFEKARELGCPLRIHTDQFNSLGATSMALGFGAQSVDHLEATTKKDTKQIATSDTVAVMLPVSGFHVDDRYAPGRALIDAGATVAIATNYNPGSAPSPSMPLAMALACRKLGLTPAEAIVAATFNPACVLGCQGETGSIEVGKRADLTLWDEVDERAICYEVASRGPVVVLAGGRIVRDHRP